ncbi:imidazole glycerol phosphate synthase subunit HisF [Candidatus Vidania fulgoroideorum]
MICKRIIACLDVHNNTVVKGKQFVKIKNITCPVRISKKYYKQKIDEIIFLNIKKEKITKILNTIKQISNKINIPLTVGGNINTMKEIDQLLKAGADKISLNSTLYYNKNIVKKITTNYGSQILVASIDVKKQKNKYFVYINGGKTNTGILLTDWCKIHEKKGIGELLITSIDNDGLNKGYDIKLFKTLSSNVPIIASGGGGKTNTIAEFFKKTRMGSVLIASILHYKKETIKNIKTALYPFYFIKC